MLTLFTLIAKIINEIFEEAETKKEIEELKSKKMRFFLKKKLVGEIGDKIVEKMDKINERNKKMDKRRPSSRRGEAEKKMTNNSAFISMGKKIHDEVRKTVEAKLNEIIFQKS